MKYEAEETIRAMLHRWGCGVQVRDLASAYSGINNCGRKYEAGRTGIIFHNP
jgi:hypothetical protein